MSIQDRIKAMLSRKFIAFLLSEISVTVYGAENTSVVDPEWIVVADAIIAVGYFISNALSSKWSK